MSLDLKSKFHQINLNGVKPSGSVIYGFEDYRLDAEHLMLYHSGDEVSLTPKQIETLIALIEERGEIVSKEVLMHRLWGETAVEESNLTQNIYILRKVLGKTRDGMPMIETLRRRGYRFNAEVTDHRHRIATVSAAIRSAELAGIPDPLSPNEPTDVPERDTPDRRSNKKVAAAIAGIGLLAAVIVAGYFAFFARPGSAGAPRTIVVLPVAPMNTADRNVLYEIGIADSLINRLASVEGFTIRPLSSVRSYADAPMHPISVGHEQKADFVLASNYQVVDGRIKVTAQLYNVASGKVDETFKSQQNIANVFSAQDAIAAEFGNRLIERFNASPIRPTKGRGTSNEEAYRLYQQGMYLIDKRRPENSKKALDYLEQAVELDPNYAQAWAGKAEAIWTSGQRDENQIKEAIQKALAINPSLSEAYSALCTDNLLYDYDFVEAEATCKHAIDLDPSSSAAHRAYSWVLSFHGKHDDALAAITKAIDLEPVSYINKRDLGNALYIARHYDEAAAQWRRLVELDPTDPVVYNQLIRTLEAQGKDEEAFEWFIKLLNVRQRDEHAIAQYQLAYQKSGWRGVLLERAIDPNIGFGYPTDFHIAGLYAQAREKDKAFEYLERSFQQREWAMPQLQVYPQLDPIRDDPRYADLVRRVEGK